MGAWATERYMLDLLHKRYGQKSQNGAVIAPRYICAEHVRTSAGFGCRTMDFAAVDTWESSMRDGLLTIHGVEVKVSRSDWLRELKDPAKSAETMTWVTHRWLAIPIRTIIAPGELPDGWGLLLMQGNYEQKLTAKIQATPRNNGPMSPTATAALLRAAVKTAIKNQDNLWLVSACCRRSSSPVRQ